MCRLAHVHKRTAIPFSICEETYELHRCVSEVKEHLGRVVRFMSQSLGAPLIVLDVISRSQGVSLDPER